jgi:coenzyme F420-0:L-glutamate ligase/coenzyme F420-1:gamma-L-glutamate ligase
MDKARTGRSLTLIAVPDFPLVEPGDDLAQMICGVVETNGPELVDHDVIVIAQKVVSKAEGRYVDLAAVKPGSQALALSVKVQKDPR